MRTAAMDDYFFNEIKSHPFQCSSVQDKGNAGTKREGRACRVRSPRPPPSVCSVAAVVRSVHSVVEADTILFANILYTHPMH